ncbi:sensory neuron membrane protein 2 [Halyomorpha halys]|uniref:sensory neuron membrane protein 2 n=1 Tax=Halyomorpha halys TaxID=286706 RepID=UPI0006D4D154|nr:sensory neuron membrane protein 2-like [Halyomorpha halys]
MACRVRRKLLMLLNNGTKAMEAFYIPQTGVFEVYIFNITNPEEFSEGGIATVEEVGPYVYEQIKDKFDIEFTEGDTISYRIAKHLYFNANKSGILTESDVVTVLNAPLLVLAYLFENEFPEDLSYFNTIIPDLLPEKQKLCIKVTVKDLLFDGIRIFCGKQRGHGIDICDKVRKNPVPSIRQIPDSEDLAFSYFSSYNGSRSKLYKIKRGNENIFELGHIVEYDNQTFLSMWPNDSACSDLKGTDWEFFPPPYGTNRIHLLFPETCFYSIILFHVRSLYAFHSDEEMFGMKLFGYFVSIHNFYADEIKCMCKEDKHNRSALLCTRPGVIDIERCTGEPFFISFPHAAYSDYFDDVIGYKESTNDEYYSAILLQPRSGFPVTIQKQLQTNILLRKMDELTILKNISERMIPLVWFKETIMEERRYPHIEKVKVLIDHEMQIATICGILIGFGILLFLIAYFMHSTSQSKKEIHPKIHSVRPIFELERRTRIDGLY